jgi:hypothetical protein
MALRSSVVGRGSVLAGCPTCMAARPGAPRRAKGSHEVEKCHDAEGKHCRHDFPPGDHRRFMPHGACPSQALARRTPPCPPWPTDQSWPPLRHWWGARRSRPGVRLPPCALPLYPCARPMPGPAAAGVHRPAPSPGAVSHAPRAARPASPTAAQGRHVAPRDDRSTPATGRRSDRAAAGEAAGSALLTARADAGAQRRGLSPSIILALGHARRCAVGAGRGRRASVQSRVSAGASTGCWGGAPSAPPPAPHL